MNFQLTRHLDVAADDHTGPFQQEGYLLINRLLGTRLLGDEKTWELLRAYEHPRELDENPPIQRAAAANILVPIEGTPEPSQLVERFRETAHKVLRYRKVEAAESVPALLEQLDSACVPIGQYSSNHYMWSDPKKLFRAMLEHFKVYAQEDAMQGQAGPVVIDFAKLCLGRPQRNGEFAQQLCTISTSVARALRVWERFPQGADILTLGDDDLMSLVLTQRPGYRVTVFEIDPALVRFLRRRKNRSVDLHSRDLSNGLPSEFQGRFDVVLADPPYNVEGMGWFMDCCLSALKRRDSRLYLSTCPVLLEDAHHLFEQLQLKGLRIEQTFPNFNRYPFPQETHAITKSGLMHLGYHPALVEILTEIPYLYAHLYECVWKS